MIFVFIEFSCPTRHRGTVQGCCGAPSCFRSPRPPKAQSRLNWCLFQHQTEDKSPVCGLYNIPTSKILLPTMFCRRPPSRSRPFTPNSKRLLHAACSSVSQRAVTRDSHQLPFYRSDQKDSRQSDRSGGIQEAPLARV